MSVPSVNLPRSWPRGRDWQILVALVLAGSIFVFGRFGFFDLLGGKRFLEGVALLVLAVLSPYFVRFGAWRNSLFALASVILVSELVLRHSVINAADNFAGMLFVLALFALSDRGEELCAKLFIAFAGLFACLGIIQWVILFVSPERVPEVTIFYQDYASTTGGFLEHPLRLLGLASGEQYVLLGNPITRLRSFLSEPSLTLAFFFLPGALALTLSSAWWLWAVPLLLFPVLALSGSVFLAIALTGVSAPFLYMARRRPAIGAIFPLFVLLIVSVGVSDSSSFASLFGLLQIATADSASFLDKSHSFAERFTGAQSTFAAVRNSPFGLHEEVTFPVGLLLHAAALAGLMGVLLMVVLLWRLFSDATRAVGNSGLRLRQVLGALIIYGIFFEATIFSSYGFTNGVGILMIGITMTRLAALVPKPSHPIIEHIPT